MTRRDLVKYYLLNLALPLVVLAIVTLGVRELILAWPTGETVVNRDLQAHRTALMDRLTDYGTSLSDMPYIVALTLIAIIVFRLAYKRWRESIFLAASVWGQSLVFLATTELVGRHRPEVKHLDPAPPTSSFPSGHASAAVGFYCAVALILSLHVRNRVAQVVFWVLGVAAPLIVSYSRLYRGMHHLSDVLWGLLLGVVCLVVAARAILFKREPDVRTAPRPEAAVAGRPGRPRPDTTA